MKTIFIFPPQWDIHSPSTGIPTLMGVLSEMGVECIGYDLNIDFFNYILKSEHIIKAIEKSKKIIENTDNKYPIDKVNYTKSVLDKFYKFKYRDNLIKKIDNISNLIKDKNNFYNYKVKTIHNYCINMALDIISIPYYPFKISKCSFGIINDNRADPNCFFKYKRISEDKNYNMFIEYMENKIPKLSIEDGDLICISINSTDQILGALSAIKIIRKLYNVKIALGGSWIDYESTLIKKDKQLFTDFADYCMTGLGEIAVKELWEHHSGQRELKDVSNILYYENDNIYQTKNVNKLSKKTVNYNYNGYDFSQYFMCEPVLPIKVSYGCYWGKCKFCTYNIDKVYDPKNVDDVIQEIENLIKKYNVKYFYFQDAALSPSFIEEFADKIITKKINIRYLTNLRFEKEFDKKLLKKLYKSGLRIAQWGLESGNPKILEKYNKGIDISTAVRILKDSYNIGIFNHLYLIYNFPGETMEDFMMTINFINKYKKEIKSFAFHSFIIHKGTYIYEHPQEFSIDPELIRDKIYIPYHKICNAKEKDKIVDEKVEKLLKSPPALVYQAIGTCLTLPIIDKIPLKYLNIVYNYIKIKNKINNIIKIFPNF